MLLYYHANAPIFHANADFEQCSTHALSFFLFFLSGLILFPLIGKDTNQDKTKGAFILIFTTCARVAMLTQSRKITQNLNMLIEPATVRPVDFLPRRQTEANLQAEFYAQAKARGLSVFLEYPSRWNESPGARFDAVIHKAGKIRAILEIKRSGQPAKRRQSWPKSRQGKIYLSWPLPVFLIIEPADFLSVWEWAARAGLIGPALPLPAGRGDIGGIKNPL